MVRRGLFNIFVLLSFYQPALGSGTTVTASATAAPSNAAPVLINVASAAVDLPKPPSTTTDAFNYPKVLIARNPTALKFRNPGLPRVDIEVIPPGLRLFYEDIKGELAWFNDLQKAVLLKLFEHIINERVEEFYNFKPTFLQVFGTSYETFSFSGRSFLGWLVAFGSAEILRTLKLKDYKIDSEDLDSSIQYLVKNSTYGHLAYVATCAPFLFKAKLPEGRNFLFHVMRSPFNTQILNLAFFFLELKRIDPNIIAALIPNLPHGSSPSAITELLVLIDEIVTNIKNPNVVNRPQFFKDRAIKNLKFAVQEFISRCVADFKIFQQGDRFTVALLFIEAGNVVALEKLLIAQPEMHQTVANEKSLLQHCIDLGSLPCSALVARLNPVNVFAVCNGIHSPFFQSILYNSSVYFETFLPFLKKNELLPFSTEPFKMSPISMAIVAGNVQFLKQIVNHFISKNIAFDFYTDLQIAACHLENNFVQENGSLKFRNMTLIAHEIWLYLLNETGIKNECPENNSDVMKRSLLDYAINDRNPEAARLIIAKFGSEIVNKRCGTGPIQGNSLRFYKEDINMLKLLIQNGLDINVPVTIIKSVETGERIENVPSLSHLLKVFDEVTWAYIKTLNFTEKTLRDSLTYAIDNSINSVLQFIKDMLREKYNVTL